MVLNGYKTPGLTPYGWHPFAGVRRGDHRTRGRPSSRRRSCVRAASDAWLSAPAAEQASRLAALEGISWLELGVRNYQRFMQGLTLTLLAADRPDSEETPRPIGYAMALAGKTYLVVEIATGVKYH